MATLNGEEATLILARGDTSYEGENGNELSPTAAVSVQTASYGAIGAWAADSKGRWAESQIRWSLKLIFVPFQVIGWLPCSSQNAQYYGENQEKADYRQCLDELKRQKCKTCARIAHVAFILCIIACVSTLQILMCLRRDTIDIHYNSNEVLISEPSFCPNVTNGSICTNNLLEFIIPDILIVIAYITSFFVFYKDQNYLNDLVNKVCDYSEDADKARKGVVRKIWAQMVVGYTWLGFAFMVGIVRIIARRYAENGTPPIIILPCGVTIFLECLCTLMFISFDLVYISVIMNYSFQCQLLMDIIQAIKSRLKAGEWPVDHVIEAVEELKTSMSTHLNHYSSWNVSILMFIFVVSILYGVIALAELGGDVKDEPWVLASTLLDITQWLCILFFPLVQAARLSSSCFSLREAKAIYPEDQETPRKLEVLPIYLSSQKFHAKLVCLPVTPGAVAGFLFVTGCALIILIQTSFFSWTPTTV